MDPPVLVARIENVAQVRGVAGLLHNPGTDRPMQERPMSGMETERARGFLRTVSYTGSSVPGSSAGS